MGVDGLEWRPVPGYEGRYSVRADGLVRSEARVEPRRDGRIRRVAEIILSVVVARSGHRYVWLCKDSTQKRLAVHRLVLTAFVGPCPPGMECCHNDGDPGNNAVDNLRWDTSSANALDRIRHGTHPSVNRKFCPQGHPYDERNTYYAKTSRQCKTCRTWRDRNRNKSTKEMSL